MKDFLDQELNIGDYVVGIDHIRTSSQLFAGTISRFTAKMVEVKYDGDKKKRFTNWDSCLVSPYKVVKVNKN